MLVTSSYYNERKERLDNLHKRLEDIRKNKKDAFENCGNGWHDNPFYHHLMHDERMIENQLIEENRKFSQFQLFDESSVCEHPDTVVPGTNVRVIEKNLTTGTRVEYIIGIVPFGAEDLHKKIFVYSAPRVRPLIGARVGDIKTVSIPIGTLKIEILEISKFPFNCQPQCITKQNAITNVAHAKNNEKEKE